VFLSAGEISLGESKNKTYLFASPPMAVTEQFFLWSTAVYDIKLLFN
jgi:hypothetical protein